MSMDPLVGQVIDDYKIVQVLGQGGMGVVYKAMNIPLNRPEALKVITPQLVQEPSFLRRFQLEAQALAQIHHPNIVTVYTLRQSKIGHYITMEFVEGETLGDLLVREGAVAWPRALPIFKQFLSAFAYAHERGIIHRDIKPRNIMLTPQGVSKVMDFGLAKFYQQLDKTQTQGVSGTPFYMSPEQIRGEENLDQRSDIFSLGLTIYQVLSGTLPFDTNTSLYNVQRAIVEDDFPSPHSLNAGIPNALSTIIMKALEKDPKARFQYAGEIIDAIEAFERSGTPAPQRAAPIAPQDLPTLVDAATARASQPTIVDSDVAYHSPTIKEHQQPAPRRKLPVWLMAAGGGTGILVLVLLLIWGLSSSETMATLSIASVPSDAEVLLNGTVIGTTPLDGHEVEGTEGVMQIRKEGFVALDSTLSWAEGEQLVLTMLLEREGAPIAGDSTAEEAYATMTITSTPSNAIVWIDGDRVGRTPYTNAQTPAGTFQVRVEKDGFTSWSRNVYVEAGMTVPVQAGLESNETPPVETGNTTTPATGSGVLARRAEPDGAIFVDGRPQDASGSLSLTPGQHEIQCGEEPFATTTTVTVQANETQQFTCHFEHPIRTTVTLEDGTSTQATVLINGDAVGSSPGPGAESLQRTGTHTVSVQQAGFEMVGNAQTVTIKPGCDVQPYALSFRMRSTAPAAPTALSAEMVRQEAQTLKRRLQQAIESGSWSNVPAPVASYYQEKLGSRAFRKFDILGAGIELEEDDLSVDGTSGTLPVTMRVDIQQKGGNTRMSSPPIRSTWTMSLEGGSVQVTQVQNR